MPDNTQSNTGRKYAPNTVGKQEFVDSMSRMAAEVWDFHNRFEIGSGQFEGQSATDIVANRTSILDEEFNELAQAISEKEGDEAVADETADILFVAMGHAEAMGRPGIDGTDRVSNKAAAKTSET
ncbi:MAG: hypothetical protein HOB24_04860, partial [Chloroflexi bacterium]|nr:hypothetical protein [Chloroflexota bacterium]